MQTQDLVKHLETLREQQLILRNAAARQHLILSMGANGSANLALYPSQTDGDDPVAKSIREVNFVAGENITDAAIKTAFPTMSPLLLTDLNDYFNKHISEYHAADTATVPRSSHSLPVPPLPSGLAHSALLLTDSKDRKPASDTVLETHGAGAGAGAGAGRQSPTDSLLAAHSFEGQQAALQLFIMRIQASTSTFYNSGLRSQGKRKAMGNLLEATTLATTPDQLNEIFTAMLNVASIVRGKVKPGVGTNSAYTAHMLLNQMDDNGIAAYFNSNHQYSNQSSIWAGPNADDSTDMLVAQTHDEKQDVYKHAASCLLALKTDATSDLSRVATLPGAEQQAKAKDALRFRPQVM